MLSRTQCHYLVEALASNKEYLQKEMAKVRTVQDAQDALYMAHALCSGCGALVGMYCHKPNGQRTHTHSERKRAVDKLIQEAEK